jgi:hypothetical protein
LDAGLVEELEESVGALSGWFWLRLLDRSAARLTDGRVPFTEVPALARGLASVYTEARPGEQVALHHGRLGVVPAQVTEELLLGRLLHSGLVVESAGDVVIPDFDAYTVPREATIELARGSFTRKIRERTRGRRRRGDPVGPVVRGRGQVPPVPVLGAADTVSTAGGQGSSEEDHPTAIVQQPASPLSESLSDLETPAVEELAARVATLQCEVDSDAVGWALRRLSGFRDYQQGRTAASIRRTLASHDLPDSALVDAMAILEHKMTTGEIFRGECAYFVGTLAGIGRKRRRAS